MLTFICGQRTILIIYISVAYFENMSIFGLRAEGDGHNMDTKQKNILLLAILFIVFASSAVILNEKTKTLQKEAVLKIGIVNSEKNEIKFLAEVADNESERQKGLMFRKNLPLDSG